MLTRDRADNPSDTDDPDAAAAIAAPIDQHAAHDDRASSDVGHGWRHLGVRDRRLIRLSAGWGALVGFVPFISVLWDFSYWPLRTAGKHRFASSFYDSQARALLHGHLDVQANSLGIEGFVVDGRTYMYFPPFPAILRMPVAIVTDRLDSQLTAPSMLVAWLVLAAATIALVWNVRFAVRGASAVGRAEAALLGLFVVSVTGGSVVVFHAALPWVYHEVYLWATALTTVTLAALVCVGRAPSQRAALVAGCGALCVILTRTTSGWAMAITLVATGASMFLRGEARGTRVPLTLVALGVAALTAGIAVNWVKFRHPYMFPLDKQIWTGISGRRRLALRLNGGTITGPQFFRSGLVNYFRPDGIRFVPYFPFVTLPATPARSYGGAFLDQWYRTGSVPAFMPLLFGTSLWGIVTAFRPTTSVGIRSLRVPLVGALAVAGGVMFYGYIAHRYISEFLPILMLGGAVGMVDIARRTTVASRRWKRGALAVVGAFALFGMIANSAVSVATARLTWRGDRLVDYLAVQHRVSSAIGHADDMLAQYFFLPQDGPADQLAIIGQCDALYVATGDDYEPWITVEVRDHRVTIAAAEDGALAGVTRLMVLNGLHRREISLETDGAGRGRIRLGEGLVFFPGDWFDLEPGRPVVMTMRVDTELDRFYVDVDGVEVGHLAAAENGKDRPFVITQPAFDLPDGISQTIQGLELTASWGERLDLCEGLLDELPSNDP